MPDPAQEREMTEPHSSHVMLYHDVLDSSTQEIGVFDKCLQTYSGEPASSFEGHFPKNCMFWIVVLQRFCFFGMLKRLHWLAYWNFCC